jgi:GPH family glycoside/pentoside/hexuronide:cation symporter
VSNWPVKKEDYLPQLERIAPHVEWVRTYNNTMPDFGLEAHKLGLKVAAGAVLERTRNRRNRREVERLIRETNAGHVDLAIIGNESIFDLMKERGERGVPPAIHIRYIETFRRSCPHVPVTTAQDAKHLIENPEVMAACDVIAMHSYPYWAHVSIDNAVAELARIYGLIKSMVGDKEVLITETGWPAKGQVNGAAVPSAKNASRYAREVTAWANHNGVKVWHFEAYDEPWKADFEGALGAHWGHWTAEGKRKIHF